MQLKDRFRQVRLENGYSMSELARKADLSFSYISGIENGRATPSFKTATAIAQACNISLLELLRGIDFAGEMPDEEPLPAGLRELVEVEEFAGEIDADWLALLRSIQLRGRRPASLREWMGLYLHLRLIFGGEE